MHAPRPPVLVVMAILAGTVLAAVLGILTFGVQATVEPRGLPVAVAVPDGAPATMQQAAQRIASQGGGQLSWRVTTPAEGRRLLDDKQVYGVLELPATVVVSGAVNPTGTQLAQQALTAAAQAAAQAAQAGQPGPSQPVTVQTVHPASAAARTAPLAAAALLWLGTLVGSVLVVVVSGRAGRRTTAPVRVATAVGVAVGATGAVLGLLALWDVGLYRSGQIDAALIGFLLLIGFAFAALQGAVLRLTGLAGMAVLAPVYLMAPAVAGQVPEVLHPAYRDLLWSWSPIRFATEGVRSLLMLDTMPPDVRTAVWVLSGVALAGLVVLLWPGRRRGAGSPRDVDQAAASRQVPSASRAA
ncbi:MAG TPA: ABC transporter permease [Pseudonocardiaceae bacterium]|jgi:hypothetical protein